MGMMGKVDVKICYAGQPSHRRHPADRLTDWQFQIAPSGVTLNIMAIDCSSVRFSDRTDLDLTAVQSLFDITAFWARDRDLDDLATAIAHSHPVITAWDGDQLVGFARATSDGVYRATIWDVVIHPDYQGAGLGRKLIHTVLSHPHMTRVERVYLMTTNQRTFYERIGFQANPTDTMVLLNSAPEVLPTWAIAQTVS